MIIDSHCHLDFDILFNQLDNVIKRANENDVKYLLTICTTLESFEKIKLITEKCKNVYGTIGIHPHESKNYLDVNCNFILNLKKEGNKIIGIGETGLDYFYNNSDKEIQKKSFIEHIKAAKELDLPLIVHSRNAESDTYDILKKESKNSNLKILMHCFTGSREFSKKLIDLNCYISVSGIITFKTAKTLTETISQVPLDNLMVETDSPYLAPTPYRGKSNEPSFIIHTVNKLAEIKKVPKEEIMKKTSDNFLKIFNLKK
tara:strand:+ start:1640 stop:2416 length:777 start_codon:yes stop_codon:yes gene_type:complete